MPFRKVKRLLNERLVCLLIKFSELSVKLIVLIILGAWKLLSITFLNSPELPNTRGRFPHLPGARKRYHGHDELSRRLHLEDRVDATGSNSEQDGT